jgi:RNA ligase (TIGR02306 family)
MSKLKITVSKIEEIKPHPNANKMELIRTKGWWCCTGINNFKLNDKVVHFPPETLIPEEWAIKWTITKVCEEVIVNNKKYYKISVPKLRGVRSFGFCIKPDEHFVDDEVTEYYGVLKYETPYIDKKYKIKALPNLFKYNDIHQINEKNDMFKPDDEVVITEKIHGMNFCVGYIRNPESDNNYLYVSSSHRQRIPIEDEFYVTLFKYIKLKFTYEFNDVCKDWLSSKLMGYVYSRKKSNFIKVERKSFSNKFSTAFKSENLLHSLYQLSIKDTDGRLLRNYYADGYCNDVLIYGEIYGKDIQDMKYGKYDTVDFRIFDIRINGQFVDYNTFDLICNTNGLNKYKVNELFRGKFKDVNLLELCSGPTTMCYDTTSIKEKFKGKEGLVIKPVVESIHGNNDRKIAKFINPDYITRKNENRTEYH